MLVREAKQSENVSDGTADTNADRKPDGPIVPAKQANKAGTPVAESVEERGSLEGDHSREMHSQRYSRRTPCRNMRSTEVRAAEL